MQHITKLKLAATHQLCDALEKSSKFTIQFMQDMCEVDLDTVLKYLEEENHEELFKEINSLGILMEKFKNSTIYN